MKIDKKNIGILTALLNDPDLSSKEIAAKLGAPLSTVQRRRSMLERSVLKKKYSLDMKELGWRTAEIFVAVDKGNSGKIAERLLSKPNVVSASIRVGDPRVNVAAEIFFRSTMDLHEAVEDVKSLPNVAAVEWSEYVKLYTKKQNGMLGVLFGAPQGAGTSKE